MAFTRIFEEEKQTSETAGLTDSLKLVQRSLTAASLIIQQTFNSLTARARTKGTHSTPI